MNAYGTMREEDVKFLQETIARTGRGASALIPILQALQEHHGYLPEDSLRLVPEFTEITAANLTGVSTFYDMFRHQPTGKHIVRICRGTACHVAGADRVEDALRRRLRIPPGRDTDAEGLFTLEPVACLGCCTLAPVMKIDGATLGVSNAEAAPDLVRNFLRERQAVLGDPSLAARPGTGAAGEIRVGLGSCCMAKGSDRLFHELQTSAAALGAPISVKPVGCVGMCHRTPLVEFVKAGEAHKFYAGLGAASASWVVRRHFGSRGLGHRISRLWTRMMDGLLFDEPPADRQAMRFSMSRRDPAVSAFLDSQKHIVTEHFGKLNPLDLDEYIAHDGFTALRKCLPPTPGAPALTPEEITATVENSGLRGRGGAGFPTGAKWRLAAGESGEVKYVICNGDEGDPGAFMDRMILESFPYRVIEGLAIAAIAIGAHEGIFYVRHEYPLAVTRLRAAIAEMERRGWLGARLLGADYQLRLSVAEGAGAFVCGEETALIASLEGKRGTPRLRPPFPAQSGLWEKPTLINNVETLAAVPWILRNGAQAFATIGVGRSKGTKVFALAGKVRRGGLIEVPMGMTIRQIVEDIGGGVADGRRFKAVQIGGPSGGCVPARLADTPVDYESLAAVGAIMGSGGMVVLDDTTCMVDIARYFLRFTQDQSCGKCTFCRVGTRRMLDIMDRICAGKADHSALQSLEHLAHQVCGGSLCGLGRTAPNPVLSTLKYFREEYEAHLHGRCPAGRCTQLITYRVTPECTGCTLCAQRCPAQAIPFSPYARHEINLDLCTRCDTCRQACPANAIEVS